VRGFERLALPIFKEKFITGRGCFFMPGIKITSRDSFDDAYRKFKRQCDRNLIVTEARARQHYETATEARKKEKIATRKKILKKLYMLRRYEARL
jgi:small subunit ribosomal protein S21